MSLIRSFTMGAAVIGIALSAPAFAGTLPGPVVSAEWLKAHMSEVTVLDVREDTSTYTTPPTYEKDAKSGEQKLADVGGRIEGALPVDFGKLRVTRKINGQDIGKMLPDKADFQEIMDAAGLNKGKPIVITSLGDSGGEMEQATRLYWSLKVYGADQIAILNGGLAAWLEGGNPVTTAPAKVTRGNWAATDADRYIFAETSDVEAASRDQVQLVDARPIQQYAGIVYKKPAVKAPGHVAGAKNYPADARYRPDGLAASFLTASEYRAIMKMQGIDPDAPTITYCNTGHLASGQWFVQSEIVGNKHVKLYDGSMLEWTTEGKPVVGLGS